MSGEVLTERRGAVTIVTINRPEQANALNAAAREGLREAFAGFEADPEAKAAILTGAGERVFCAGADLEEMAETGLALPPRDFIPRLDRDVSKPIVAAVNGAALAGGFLLQQMCDLCLASENTTFGITEARWGRGAPWAVPLRGMIPQRLMMELLLTAEPIGAARAYEIGLVNRVVSSGELLPAALELAEKIASLAPLTVRGHRRIARLAAELGESAALEAAAALFEPVYLSEDAKEGPRAFRERRAPLWQGR